MLQYVEICLLCRERRKVMGIWKAVDGRLLELKHNLWVSWWLIRPVLSHFRLSTYLIWCTLFVFSQFVSCSIKKSGPGSVPAAALAGKESVWSLVVSGFLGTREIALWCNRESHLINMKQKHTWKDSVCGEILAFMLLYLCSAPLDDFGFLLLKMLLILVIINL